MATVYRARQPRLKRDVAVKVMLPFLAADLTFRERFELKAQAIASLRHSNILSIHDKLSTDLRQLDETDVSVQQVPDVIESSEAALALGRERGATTVIWGYDDDIGISPHVETVGGAREGLLSVGLERFNLEASGEADFKRYIAQDLPQEVAFLTALSLVQTFAPQGCLDQTMT